MNFHRGDRVWSNRIRIDREALEAQLLAHLQNQVLREEVVDYVLDRFEDDLVLELEKIGGEMEQTRARKGDLELEIKRLTAGLASSIHSPAFMVEIAEREREISDISDRLLSSESSSVRARIKALRERARQRIALLREYLNADTQLAPGFPHEAR